jgi:hypothetical protein
MAKTRRKKINKQGPLKSRNIKLFIANPGERVQISGAREDASKQKPSKSATPIFLGRQYTGVNRGKVYPYASAKRRGTGIQPAPRKTVVVEDQPSLT